MTAIWIILGILCVLLFILLQPVRIRIYDSGGLHITARVLFLHFTLYPGEGNTDFLILVPAVLSRLRVLLRRALRFLRVRIKVCELTVATDDAAKTAVLYGHAQTLACAVAELFYQYRVASPEDCERLRVRCDFLRNTPAFRYDITASILIIQILSLLFTVLFAFLRRGDYRLISKALGGDDDAEKDPETLKKQEAARKKLIDELAKDGL